MRLAKILLILCAGSTLATCGKSGRPQDDGIKISVTPTKTLLLPGAGSTCNDIVTAAAAATIPSTSVQELRLVLTDFGVDWYKRGETLNIVRITVSITNANIKATGGLYKKEITGGDLYNLLSSTPSEDGASRVLTLPFPSTTAASTEFVSLHVANARTPLAAEACTFQVGGIEVIDKAPRFLARAKIEILGYSQQSDSKEFFPVKTSIFVDAEYVP